MTEQPCMQNARKPCPSRARFPMPRFPTPRRRGVHCYVKRKEEDEDTLTMTTQTVARPTGLPSNLKIPGRKLENVAGGCRKSPRKKKKKKKGQRGRAGTYRALVPNHHSAGTYAKTASSLTWVKIPPDPFDSITSRHGPGHIPLAWSITAWLPGVLYFPFD